MTDHRITVLFPIIAMGVGGAEQQLLELVKGIDKARFRPIVAPLYRGFELDSEVSHIPGVKVICLDRKSRYDFSTLLKVHRILKQERVDIIQPFLTPATFFGLLPAVINHTPIKIVTERCGVRVQTGLGNKLYRSAEDFLTRVANWIIPNSEAGKNYLIERGINPAKIKVIYNGINLKRLTPDLAKVSQIRNSMGVSPDGKVVGITASLTPAKDHTTFLQAAQIISRVMPQTKYSIVGDGPLRAILTKQVNDLGLDSQVTFHGIQRDIGSYMAAFDIACLCSSDHEGCSNALLEAMALGKPVVATDVGGNKELIEHGMNGLLVPVRSAQALADAILTCINRVQWSRQMGERGRETIFNRFSLERMVSEYEQLYEQALRAKLGGRQ